MTWKEYGLDLGKKHNATVWFDWINQKSSVRPVFQFLCIENNRVPWFHYHLKGWPAPRAPCPWNSTKQKRRYITYRVYLKMMQTTMPILLQDFSTILWFKRMQTKLLQKCVERYYATHVSDDVRMMNHTSTARANITLQCMNNLDASGDGDFWRMSVKTHYGMQLLRCVKIRQRAFVYLAAAAARARAGRRQSRIKRSIFTRDTRAGNALPSEYCPTLGEMHAVR